MENIFDKKVTDQLIERINSLTNESQPKWGKMSVGQMFAHCSVAYEMAYEDKHPKPGKVGKFFLKLFVKSIVVNEKPYKPNGRTAPQFLMTESKDFENEKARLIEYLLKTVELGESYFEGKESHSFGVLTIEEWNNSFYKHLDHHLKQFGV